MNLDVGETVMIESWNADGTSSVKYRGANWVAIHRQGVQPSTGPHRVAELVAAAVWERLHRRGVGILLVDATEHELAGGQ